MKKIFVFVLVLIPFVGIAQKNVTVKECEQMMREIANLQIIDVRTPIEFDSVSIQNSVNIDYKKPNFKDSILMVDKNLPVLVYCRSGKRSYNAMQIMISLGFKEVYNMQGGILAFKSEFPEKVK